jgi:hypothetical protein
VRYATSPIILLESCGTQLEFTTPTGKASQVCPRVGPKRAQKRVETDARVGDGLVISVFTDDVGGGPAWEEYTNLHVVWSSSNAQCPSGEQRRVERKGWLGAPLSTASGYDRLGIEECV